LSSIGDSGKRFLQEATTSRVAKYMLKKKGRNRKMARALKREVFCKKVNRRSKRRASNKRSWIGGKDGNLGHRNVWV